MASSLVKSNRMKRLESNSRWLQENLEEMDHNVKRMLKLIEEDADSFAKKAELYFKKRPELVALVEEFHRMHRTLAERYNHMTGELKKNSPSDLQSQGSGVSEAGSEPPSLPSETKPARTKSGPRAAGFDFFLGSSSDLNGKEGDESSTLDYESESDGSSVNNYSTLQSNGEEQATRRRIMELETELHETKEKLRSVQEETSTGFHTCNNQEIAAYEEELRMAKENMNRSNEEITHLKVELQKYEALGDPDGVHQENIVGSETEEGSGHEIEKLEHDLRAVEKKVRESDEEVASMRLELTSKISSIQTLQKEVSVWKNRVEREKREVSRMQDRIVRYNTNLSERDQEIRGLKESIGDANKALSEENKQLQAEMTRMTKEQAYLEENLKEIDLRCQTLDEDVRRLKVAKDETEAIFGARIEQLETGIAERDDHIEELKRNLDELQLKHEELVSIIDELNVRISLKDDRLQQLQLQHAELIMRANEALESTDVLRVRVKKLEKDVETKQEALFEAEEGKREVIRQLCVSIEHYRSGYHELRLAVAAHGRPAVMVR